MPKQTHQEIIDRAKEREAAWRAEQERARRDASRYPCNCDACRSGDGH